MTTLDFGLEIECLLPLNNAGQPMTQLRLAQLITAGGVPCTAAGYSHTAITTWKIVRDGSLSPSAGTAGYEIVSPPLKMMNVDQIEKVCEVLQALGATVNRSCGLHVHVDARRLPLKAQRKLAELYIIHEPVIEELLPPSRRGTTNSFCKTVRNANVVALSQATSVEGISIALNHGYSSEMRYVSINFAAYWRHGTVEFRSHSATVQAGKIIKWVTLCEALVRTAVKEADLPFTLAASPTDLPWDASTPLSDPSRHPYWRNGGRRRRALLRMLTRPEGVTRPELQAELGLQTPPLIRRHLEACGADTRNHATEYRNGHEIYRLWLYPVAVPNPPVPAATPVPRPVVTLDGLCARLELAEEDKSYWKARAAQMTTATTPAAMEME